MEQKNIGELLAKLADLYKQRSMLEVQKYKARGNEIISGAINAVESKISSVAGRFARAYETSEKRKEEVANYKQALEGVNNEYEDKINKIKSLMLECETTEKKALATRAIEKKAMRETAKDIRKQIKAIRQPAKGISVEQDLSQLETQLKEISDKARLAREQNSKSKENAEKIVKEAREKRKQLEKNMQKAIETRDDKLKQLTEDRQMVKQTPLSRFFGMFGRGAKSRVESIEKAMNERTVRAIDEKRAIRADIASNAEQRAETSKEIVESLKDKFAEYSEMASATIATCKDAVTGKVKDMMEFAKDSVKSIKLQAKGTLQKSIKGMLEGLNKYAEGLEETQQQQQALKDKMATRAKKNEAMEM